VQQRKAELRKYEPRIAELQACFELAVKAAADKDTRIAELEADIAQSKADALPAIEVARARVAQAVAELEKAHARAMLSNTDIAMCIGDVLKALR
jgi:t-SNARE complex subunit (syntaxin)